MTTTKTQNDDNKYNEFWYQQRKIEAFHGTLRDYFLRYMISSILFDNKGNLTANGYDIKKALMEIDPEVDNNDLVLILEFSRAVCWLTNKEGSE